MKAKERIFVALDLADINQALELSSKLLNLVGGVKLGKQFFTANGLKGVQRITETGIPIFLDLKFHDIPNTVASALKAALTTNPYLINVHASGGRNMLETASRTVKEHQGPHCFLIGVTMLTSLEDADLTEIGIKGKIEDQVVRLSKLALSTGLDGVVCSAKEIKVLRKNFGKNFKLIVPGIRPKWAIKNDQKRIVTPSQAIRYGADYIIIGRPITSAKNPLEAVFRILEEIDGV